MKSGVTPSVIVRSSDCEWLKLLLVPMIIIEVIVLGVPGSTVIMAVEFAVPPGGGVTLVGENATCTPVGSIPVAKVTAALNAPSDVIVTRSEVELPEVMVSAPPLRMSEKSAAGVTWTVKVQL